LNLRERLQRRGEYIWELPAETVENQRVPVILYLSPALFELLEDEAIRQAANAATLRGVQKAIYVMPDVHVGYGFPVGGVMATDVETGIISPGSVGYDINCLPEGTRILSDLGYSFRIEEYRGERLIGVSGGRGKPVTPVLLFKRKEKRLLRLRTSLGYTLRLTADHPLLTRRGMVAAERLREGEKVALYPFRGVPYEEPPSLTLLERTGDPETDRELGERGLLPLRTDSPVLPRLLKPLGKLSLGTAESPGDHVLHRLLKALLPDDGLPGWMYRLPLWMKRLYVAGILGSCDDLSIPSDSRELLKGVSLLLSELGVTSRLKGRSLLMDAAGENLLKLVAAFFPECSRSLRSELLHRLLGKTALSLVAGGEELTAEAFFQDILWDEVTDLREESYEGWVYDFTVADREHNFVAEGFVVSNCGVRLIATNLRREDVEPRIRELMGEILRKVPSGVGSRGGSPVQVWRISS